MFGLMLEPEEKKLLPFRGMPVCLLMKDGSRKVGQLTSCGSGRLVLNGKEAGEDGSATVSRKSAARRTSRKRARKAPEATEFRQPQTNGEWDELSLAPFGPEPIFSSMPRESVPLKSVDSILIL